MEPLNKLPYVNQPTGMVKILEKIRHAQTPERFTIDFLQTKLGCRGGNYRQFIPLAKKLNLLASDGRPTELYKKFRNGNEAGAAIAAALRTGYREIFERNEYAQNLTPEQFKGLVVEITGLDSKNRIVALTCQTFGALKKLANFDAEVEAAETTSVVENGDSLDHEGNGRAGDPVHAARGFGMNLAYTINLVLPKSEDPAVFNAIFKALREHMLQR